MGNDGNFLIIGGGIAGLSAAWELQKRNKKWLLLEAGERLGGKISTRREENFLIEEGPDSFLTLKPAALELCRELGLESELVPAAAENKTVFIWSRGRLRPLPPELMLARAPSAWNFLTSGLLSFPAKLRAALEPWVPAKETPDETLASFIVRRFGSEMLERIIQPLASGIYAGIPEEMSVRCTFPRLAEMERRHGSVIRGLRNEGAQSAFGAKVPAFMSLKGGLSSVTEALENRLPKENIKTGKRIRNFKTRTGEDYVFETEEGEIFSTPRVILACPASEAGKMLSKADPELGARLLSIRHASSAVLSLAYPLKAFPEPLKSFGFLVPREENMRILGASFVSVKFPHRSPGDHVLIRCFLGGAGNSFVLEKPDQELETPARRELEQILKIQGQPVLSRLRRWENANPQYGLNHASLISQIREDLLKSWPGVAVAGADYDGIGIPDCIVSGRNAAG